MRRCEYETVAIFFRNIRTVRRVRAVETAVFDFFGRTLPRLKARPQHWHTAWSPSSFLETVYRIPTD